MLALTRKEGEGIILSTRDDYGRRIEIIVSVAESRGGTARIGIEAPASVKILRQELAGQPQPVAGEAGR